MSRIAWLLVLALQLPESNPIRELAVDELCDRLAVMRPARAARPVTSQVV